MSIAMMSSAKTNHYTRTMFNQRQNRGLDLTPPFLFSVEWSSYRSTQKVPAYSFKELQSSIPCSFTEGKKKEKKGGIAIAR